MKSLQSLVLVLIVVFLPVLVFAKTYDVESTGEYVMGDSDTKIEARRLALEHAKRLASEQIGTYLESETVVRDNQLEKDEIRSYTSAILKTTVLSEGVNLLSDKTTVFTIKIKANVDTSVLERKVKEIKGDTKRKEQLDRLQAENIKLLKELETVSAQLRSGKTEEYKKLREQRETLFERLDQNENSIRITFEKGTLFGMALKNKDEKNDLKKSILSAFQYYANSIKFKLSEPQIRNNGNYADIIINATWDMPKVDEFLSLVSTFYNNPYRSKVSVYDSINLYPFNFKSVSAEELYEYASRFSIILVINAGSHTEKEYIHFSNSTRYGRLPIQIHLSRGKSGNEVVIKNVSLAELDSISNIDAKVALVENNK